MNYIEFRQYQKTISKTLKRLDDLNPFEIKVSEKKETQTSFINWFKSNKENRDYNFYQGKGVRHLLDEIFIRLQVDCNKLILPNDVYPVYQEIGRKYFLEIDSFETFPKLELKLPEINNVILLIPNPLIPVGRMLKIQELDKIKSWIKNGENRYVIFDSCYNFTVKSIIDFFESENVFELFSSSKLFLKNKTIGLAISRRTFNKWEYSYNQTMVDSSIPLELHYRFQSVWETLTPELRKIDANWSAPEQGYLSLIRCDYLALSGKYNVAGIPITVFGSNQTEYSVLSILSILKDELY